MDIVNMKFIAHYEECVKHYTKLLEKAKEEGDVRKIEFCKRSVYGYSSFIKRRKEQLR